MMAPVKPRGVIVAAIAAISIAIASYYYLCKSNKKTKLSLSFNNKKKKLKRNGLVDAIGNTPLIRINSLSEATGCEVSFFFFCFSIQAALLLSGYGSKSFFSLYS